VGRRVYWGKEGRGDFSYGNDAIKRVSFFGSQRLLDMHGSGRERGSEERDHRQRSKDESPGIQKGERMVGGSTKKKEEKSLVIRGVRRRAGGDNPGHRKKPDRRAAV